MGTETRPGAWLSPGDALEWDLPAGPPVRISGSYDGALARSSAEGLRLEVGSADPSAPPKWSEKIPVAIDAGAWRSWSATLPSREAPSILRLRFGHTRESESASLFVTEPVLSTWRRDPPRTIVLLLVDTLRADHVSGYGYRLPTTPNLDRFFEAGLRAETCVPAANWTLPSHASLFTSTSVARHRVGRYGHVLPPELETLSESLGRKGYRTLAVTGGGYIDASFGFARGFDRYAVVAGPAHKAVTTALEMLAEARGEPAFLFLHTYQVHDFAPDRAAALRLFAKPDVLGPRWEEGIAALRTEIAMVDRRFPGWIRARYDAALKSVDDAFSELLRGLERQGRLERTAVLFTSDHGEALCDRELAGQCLEWGHGSPYLFEEELRVPLEVRIPWRPELRGVIRGTATLLDVAPTLVAAAGADLPATFEGRSLLSGAAAPDRVAVTEAPPLDAVALREGSAKLIRRTGGAQKSLFDERSYYYRLATEECFDLSRDPAERRPVPCDARLEQGADRYAASSFSDALVVRVPAREPGNGPHPAVLRARGKGAAPAIWTFGLASPPEFTQKGDVSEIRFGTGLAPVWIAFEPRDGAHALEVESSGLSPLWALEGKKLSPGTYRWTDLAWEGAALPESALIFTTSPSARSSAGSASVSSDLAARLLSLGYVRGAPALSPGLSPAPAVANDSASSLEAGEVRIVRAD